MNQYKKLLKNSFIFALGNLGSKLIAFLLLPLYTMALTKSEYGITDLAQTTVQLVLPIVTLSIYDAVLRFGMEKDKNKSIILSNGFFITTLTTAFIFVFYFILAIFINIPYLTYICVLLIIQSYQTLFSQYIKSIGKVKEFALNGIFQSLFTMFFSLIFLKFYNLKIEGFFIALILSNFLSCIFLVFKGRVLTDIRIKMVNVKSLKTMLNFSIPLIPNSIAWWLTNAVNRYFILFFLGTASNGIFAVANKIPMLLSVLNSIFFQAWQMSSIEEYNSKNAKKFYSTTFLLYSQFLFIGTIVILIVLKPLMKFIVNDSYYNAWRYVPLLLITVIYSSFSGFFGQNYIAAKKTFGIFTTTVVGAIINILGSLLLTEKFGLYGIGISSSISFLVLWIVRIFGTKKFVTINIDLKNIVLNHIILVIQIVGLFQQNNLIGVLSQMIALFSCIIVNNAIFKVWFKFLNKLLKRNSK